MNHVICLKDALGGLLVAQRPTVAVRVIVALSACRSGTRHVWTSKDDLVSPKALFTSFIGRVRGEDEEIRCPGSVTGADSGLSLRTHRALVSRHLQIGVKVIVYMT